MGGWGPAVIVICVVVLGYHATADRGMARAQEINLENTAISKAIEGPRNHSESSSHRATRHGSDVVSMYFVCSLLEHDVRFN